MILGIVTSGFWMTSKVMVNPIIYVIPKTTSVSVWKSQFNNPM